jgi:glycosyltransferase involved in cell wall biosynthesis
VYVYATQMTAALGPWLRRLTGGAPYLLHVQDLWPDSITGSSLVNSRLGELAVNGVLTPWLSSVYKHASAVVGIGPTMIETFRKRGVDPERTHLVYNWSVQEPDRLAEPSLPAATPASTTTVLYAGNVGDMQDLETAVRAAHQTRDEGVRLVLVGDGTAVARLRELAQTLGATNVEFRGWVPVEEVLPLYRQADYALVSLKDLPAFRGTIPSKFQMALSAGVPVVTTVQGDVRDIVEQNRVGFTADAESVESLAAAFRSAAGQHDRAALRRNAATLYAERFSTEAGVSAIESILAGCVQR